MVWHGMVWHGMVWYGMVFYKTRAACLLNGFKNEPLEAVRIPLYKDHNLYIKNTNKIYCHSV